MAYTIHYSLGNITIIDGTLNQATSLSLPGRNLPSYGQYVDQNQVDLLQNWASSTEPVGSIPGQFWWDTGHNKMRYNNSPNSTPAWANVVVENSSPNLNVITANTVVTGNIDLTTLDAGHVITTDLSTGANTTGGTITGTWTLTAGSTINATYADLAERFHADNTYQVGTVVEIGGEREITAVRADASDLVFGVISNSAGMVMNGGAGSDTTHPKVAMTGRVPVRVVGRVRKGERLISAGDGVARAGQHGEITAFNIVGRALENKITAEEGTILAVVGARV